MRSVSIYLLILLTVASLKGQGVIDYDTLSIGEVRITTSRVSMPAGYNVETIEYGSLKIPLSSDLAGLLASSTSLYIKSYGPGALSTLSLRGTGSSHTVVAWEGIPVTTMSGAADLSLSPALIGGRMTLHNGASSMLLTSGAIGGVVNVSTDVNWNERLNASILSGAGSFGSYNGIFRIAAGSPRLQFSTQVYFYDAQNDFGFIFIDDDGNSEIKRRSSAGQNAKGILSSLHYKSSGFVTSVKVWHQSASRGLASPVIALQNSGSEKQSDKFTRIVYDIKGYKKWGSYSTALALLDESLGYDNTLADIISRNRVKTLYLKSSIKKEVTPRSAVLVSLTNDYSIVESNNYSNNTKRNSLTLLASGDYRFSDVLTGHLLLKEQFVDNEAQRPDFSSGITWLPTSGKSDVLKLSFSKNSRIPSLNDLFWFPGGNRNLKPEKSHSVELFSSSALISTERSEITLEGSLYGTSIRDMIQWTPDDGSAWSPKNIGRVMVVGADLKLKGEITRGNTILFTSLTYTLNLSRDISEVSPGLLIRSPQVIYIPQNQSQHLIRVGYKGSNIGFLSNYTGRRFTQPDNDSWLKPYLSNDIFYTQEGKGIFKPVSLSMRISNIFNRRYELMPHYPMPGRSVRIELKYQFIR